MKFHVFTAILLGLLVVSICYVSAATEEKEETNKEDEDVKPDDEKLKYAKGSLCGYCDYCKVLYYRPHSAIKGNSLQIPFSKSLKQYIMHN